MRPTLGDTHRDVDDELQFHVEQRIRDLTAAGLRPDDARAEAERQFGDVAAVRQACLVIDQRRARRVHREEIMSDLLKDLRFALRSLRHTPAFAVTAILCLALGVAVTTTIVTGVNAILVRPLPYHDADRLAAVYSQNPLRGYRGVNISYADYADWRDRNRTFSALGIWTWSSHALSGDGGDAERIDGADVSANLFPLLGVRPMLGRTFTASEEKRGQDRVVILSHGIWQRRYGGDSSIVGRTITMDAEPFTVVGVMPPRFNFPDRGDVWTPFAVNVSDEEHGNRGYAGAIGRLAPGLTMQQATADLRVISLRLQQEYHEANFGWETELVPLRDDLVGDLRTPFLIFLAAVGLVLVIACANVANLTLARGATRHREMAVRVALGASRGRLIRQLLTESLLIAAIGGAIGAGLSVFGVHLLERSFPSSVPFYISLNFDGRALAFAIVVSALTGVFFGLPPALGATRVDLNAGLRDGSQGSGDAESRHRLRSLLIVMEVAVSLVLMIGAGLLVRSYQAYEDTALGFDEQGAITARISLPFAKYGDGARRDAFYQELLSRLAALPGVTAVGSSQGIPFSGWDVQGEMEAEGNPPLPPGQELVSHFMWVSADYFRAIGVPLVSGRMLAPSDRDSAAVVGVVNETFAKQFFPNEDPIGHRVRGGSGDSWVTIVGVIRDFRHYRLPQPMGPAIYYAYSTRPLLSQTVVIRTSLPDPFTLVPALRQAARALDADVPVYDVKTLEQQVSRSLWRQRLQASALGAFATLAVVLTVIGIYGVVAYAVAQRTREIGVRMALGASRKQVLMMILLQAARLALAGVVIGLVAALVLARVVATLLYEVEPFDPLTFGLVPLLLIGVTIAATLGPARRATTVDPLLAMKAE